MSALADDWGLPIQFDSQITPRDDGGPGPLQVAPSHEGVARLFQRLYKNSPVPVGEGLGVTVSAEQQTGHPASLYPVARLLPELCQRSAR